MILLATTIYGQLAHRLEFCDFRSLLVHLELDFAASEMKKKRKKEEKKKKKRKNLDDDSWRVQSQESRQLESTSQEISTVTGE